MGGVWLFFFWAKVYGYYSLLYQLEKKTINFFLVLKAQKKRIHGNHSGVPVVAKYSSSIFILSPIKFWTCITFNHAMWMWLLSNNVLKSHHHHVFYFKKLKQVSEETWHLISCLLLYREVKEFVTQTWISLLFDKKRRWSS